MRKRIAAIDYGSKQLGLAISDERQTIALPVCMVPAGKTLQESARNIWKALESYIPQLEKIVVGMPLLLSGKTGEMGRLVQKFISLLADISKLPIVSLDERFSSVQAQRALADFKPSKRKQAIDATAAAFLLQTYLDREDTLDAP